MDRCNKEPAYKAGDVVLSIAGRDSGRYFIVIEVIDGEYLMLTDGMLRKVEKPKKKKYKHVKPISMVAAAEMSTLTNKRAEEIIKKTEIEIDCACASLS